MKRQLLFLLVALLSMLAVTTFTSCGDDEEDDIIVSPDNGNNGQQSPNIIVTVDANGNAKGGHRFVKIDEANFYIDDIKYTAKNGDLVVTGYNEAFFKGVANIISVLKYQGRTMNVVAIESEAFGTERLDFDDNNNNLPSIGTITYVGCTSMTSVSIPNSVTNIGNLAFAGCKNLTSIVIPNSVTNIGSYAFAGCTGITNIIMGSGVITIGENAFYNCKGLTSVAIPNSVATIGQQAFMDCRSMTSITIGNNATSIGEAAFRGCNNLTDVYCYAVNVPSASYSSFGDYVFSSATLHVPAGSVDAYKAVEPWKYFKRIVAIE